MDMDTGADIDEDDVIEAGATKEEALKKDEKGVKERKLYKGEVLQVEAVNAKLAQVGVLPIQPVKRRFVHHGFNQTLPPSFLVTRFEPSYSGSYKMHYYQPSTGNRMFRDVPKDLELNVLEGTRGKELMGEWDKAIETKFGHLYRRLTCTSGTDPEIFVVDAKGEVIPAWTFLGSKAKPNKYGTKDTPFKGHIYWDGFQAEFDTPADLSCLAQISDCIQMGLKGVYEAARAKHPKATLSLKSVLSVKDKVLAEAAEEHVAFGCAPSMNVYGLKGNIQDGRSVPYRFAGGHIHLGLPGWSPERIAKMVKVLDAILGVACVSLFANYDNPLRRQYYGQPGEYRLPAHGLEYRVLSNAWLAHPLIYHMVFDLARAAAGLEQEGVAHYWKAEEQEVIQTILNHDVPHAREILKRNEKLFRGVLQTISGAYYELGNCDVAAKVWERGMESAVDNPEDIAANWCLDKGWVGHSEGPNAYFAKAVAVLRRGSKV